MKGVIYKATNTFNGMVYIGQTRASFEVRKRQHLNGAKIDESNRFHTALYQYPGAFEWEVIDEFSGTREQVIHFLNVAEEYHIMKNRADNPDYGYNASTGGYSCSVWDERLKKMAKKQAYGRVEMLQYDKYGNFIREWDSLSEISMTFRKGDGRTNASDLTHGLRYGYQWRTKTCDDYPKKIDAYYSAPGNIYMVPIVSYDKDGVLIGKFKSKNAAERSLHIMNPKVRSDFSETIILKSANKPKIYCFKDDGREFPKNITIIEHRIEKKEPKPKIIPPQVPVAAYTTNGEFVAKFSRISEASIETGADVKTIKRYCKMEKIVIPFRSNPKYVWRFASEEPTKTIEVVREPSLRKEYAKKKERRVLQYSLDGTFIKEWENISRAASANTDSYGTIRKLVIGDKYIPKSNYIWKPYSDNYPMIVGGKSKADRPPQREKERRVIQYSISGEFIKVWDTAYSAVCAGEDTMHFIRKSLAQQNTKHQGKFIWRKYEEDYPQYITTPPSSPLMGSPQTLFL